MGFISMLKLFLLNKPPTSLLGPPIQHRALIINLAAQQQAGKDTSPTKPKPPIKKPAPPEIKVPPPQHNGSTSSTKSIHTLACTNMTYPSKEVPIEQVAAINMQSRAAMN